jgi:integrase
MAVLEIPEALESFFGTLAGASRELYERSILEYFSFCAEEGLDRDIPASLLPFAELLREEFVASTIWSKVSHVGAYFKVMHNVKSIHDCLPMLKSYLKQWTKEDDVKKSQVFTGEQLAYFWKNAPDDVEWLPIKVASALGIFGFERRSEIIETETSDLSFNPDGVLVKGLRRKKRNGPKNQETSFFITHPDARAAMQKYYTLIPEKTRKESNIRLLCYLIKSPSKTGAFEQPLRWTNRHIGINAVGKMPSKIAAWLKEKEPHHFDMKEPKEYTGHCFRRTAATLFVEGGGSKPMLKIAGGWSSDSVCEGYVAESSVTRRNISNTLAIPGNNENDVALPEAPSNKKAPSTELVGAFPSQNIAQMFQIHNPQNCTFYFGMPPPPTHNCHVPPAESNSPLRIQLPQNALPEPVPEIPNEQAPYGLRNKRRPIR